MVAHLELFVVLIRFMRVLTFSTIKIQRKDGSHDAPTEFDIILTSEEVYRKF